MKKKNGEDAMTEDVLEAASGQKSLPRQFFVGQNRYAAELPDNILIFCRREGRPAGTRGAMAHHRHLLLIIRDGAGAVILNGERFELFPGQMLFLKPHQMHLMLFYRQKIDWLYVTFEAAESEVWEGIVNRPMSFPERARNYLEDLLGCRIVEYGSDPMEGMRAALNILQILNTALDAVKNSKDAGVLFPGVAELNLADRVNRYLYRNLAQPLDLEKLAEMFGYSPAHLRRLYQAFMGMPIGCYLRMMRHAYAQRLLRTRGDLTLAEIGRRCGYGSCYSFSAAFRMKEGIPPGEFRRRAENIVN